MANPRGCFLINYKYAKSVFINFINSFIIRTEHSKMGKRIHIIKILSFILILVEMVAVLAFVVFYFGNLFNFQEIIKVQWALLSAAILVFIDCIYVWIISVSIASLRHKTDLHAAEVIGSDVQEAYNFAMIGLAVTDAENNVLWTNDLFKTRHIDIIDTNILEWQPELAVLKDMNLNISGDKECKITVNSRTYDVKLLVEAGLWIFKDITDFEESFNYSKEQAPVIGVLMIDNYNDVVRGDDDFNDIATKVKNEIFKYMKEYNVLLRRIKDDSYSMLLNYKNYCRMHADKFSIIDTIRNVSSGTDIPLTLSIGLAREFPDVNKLNELANDALGIAMSRGGDQVCVAVYGSEMEFYGGKSEAQEKRNRVKDRVLADSLMTLIKSSSNILVMGHSMMDMDALGACLGIKAICSRLDKKCKMVADLKITEGKTKQALLSSFSKEELDEIMISPSSALDIINPNTLLIVVDVHIPGMVMAPKLLDKCTKVVVIDHHRRGEEYIDSPVFNHIDPAASSSCEIISEFVRFCSINPRVEIPSIYATIMLSGIFLDSNHFKSKATGLRTFEACTILKEYGADNALADDLLKDNFEEYRTVSDLVNNLEHPAYGVVCVFAPEEKIVDDTSISKAANLCMSLKGNHACFVCAHIAPRKVKVSTRSDGTINVQILAEKLGGGGHFTSAAIIFDNSTIDEVKEAIYNVLQKHLTEATADAKSRKFEPGTED